MPAPAASQGQKGQPKKKTSSKAKPRQGRVVEVVPLESLRQINLNAAGVDVHQEFHYAAVPEGRDPQGPVRRFGTFTADHQALAQRLRMTGQDLTRPTGFGAHSVMRRAARTVVHGRGATVTGRLNSSG